MQTPKDFTKHAKNDKKSSPFEGGRGMFSWFVIAIPQRMHQTGEK